MKMFLARSLAKMAGRTKKKKESRHDALKTVVIEGKDTICILPVEYGKSLTVSVTTRLHTFVNVCMCLQQQW